MTPQRARFVAGTLALLLIALGAWRVAAIVGAQPLLGYGNQFDMGRTSACIGLWPDLPEPARYEAHPQAPIRHYVRGETRPAECYFSSELGFVALAAAIALRDQPLDLSLVGAIKSVALIALALYLHALLRRQPAWALAHAAVFALVICDPMNTLWLNTLYTEFAALLGAYAAIVLMIVLVAREPLSSPPPRATLGAFAISLLFLGLSRQQHLLLPAVLALPAIVSLLPRAKRAAIALAVLVCTIALIQAAAIGRNTTIAAANNADVVLGAIMPASRDAAKTGELLGLPPRCLQSTGASWYETMGESLQATCPEALAMPRSNLVRLLLREPETIVRALVRGLPQLQDWRLGYLGAVEGREFAEIETVRNVAGPAAASIAPIVTALSPSTFAFALCAALGALLLSSLAALKRRTPFALALYGLTAIVWYAITTSILGDGYVEIPRHAQLVAPALFAAVVIATLTAAARLIAIARSADRSATSWGREIAWSAATMVVAALVYTALRAVTAEMPMSNGVVDRPKRNVVTVGVIEFAGWALDPEGVIRVELVSSSGAVYPADYGLPYAGGRGESLALYFPSYPDAARGGFLAHLPASELASGAVDVRTVVVNSAGVRTDIDRRRLIVAQ